MGVYGLEGREKENAMEYWLGLELQKEFYALHYDEVHGEFFYDGEEMQVYDRGKEEKEWLKRAGMMVHV